VSLIVATGLLGFAPATSPAASLDTATATGSTRSFSSIAVNAQSDPSGANASGTVAFRLAMPVSGPVTCMSVTGPDAGPGTAGRPTSAVINFEDATFGIVTMSLTDNGGSGLDRADATDIYHRAPTDCSPILPSGFQTLLTNGRAVVVDAPRAPASKDQCKNGGWRQFGTTFKNQGQCVAFVEGGPKH
jgi:hypothetical protein